VAHRAVMRRGRSGRVAPNRELGVLVVSEKWATRLDGAVEENRCAV
jgi:hypothetical protein